MVVRRLGSCVYRKARRTAQGSEIEGTGSEKGRDSEGGGGGSSLVGGEGMRRGARWKAERGRRRGEGAEVRGAPRARGGGGRGAERARCGRGRRRHSKEDGLCRQSEKKERTHERTGKEGGRSRREPAVFDRSCTQRAQRERHTHTHARTNRNTQIETHMRPFIQFRFKERGAGWTYANLEDKKRGPGGSHHSSATGTCRPPPPPSPSPHVKPAQMGDVTRLQGGAPRERFHSSSNSYPSHSSSSEKTVGQSSSV